MRELVDGFTCAGRPTLRTQLKAETEMNRTPSAMTTRPEDMESRRARMRFEDAAKLPISFVLDGKAISGIPSVWEPTSVRRCVDANITETVHEGTDPKTGLHVRVECTEYRDFPVVEWVAWFVNQGREATPVIEDILAMDATLKGNSPMLDHCNGDFYSAEGYAWQESALRPGSTLRFAPKGGRSCDSAFPYFRVKFDGCGLTLAVGWPAQWSASLAGVTDGVRVQAGQEKTHLRLMPGESIRTPRMTLLSWAGDATRAVNLWRRWYLAHILPRSNGQPLKPLLACAATDEGEEFTAATEENQIRYIEKFRQHGIRFDVWWIDAGWYPCSNAVGERKWPITGTWEPDAPRFPRGLRPVSDRAARDGAGLLLWFEPERVRPGTRLDTEHPEWLLRVKGGEDALLNLGNPECRQWLTDHVCKLIQDNGVKVYRQDHNFPPLLHWRDNEAQDRQGMNENLHVQGYLRYWDDLLARNPGLWIDSCASGGRRNDLETMRRSVPLHYTDYGYGEHPVKLAFHRTMFEWIPYFKDWPLSWDIEPPVPYCQGGSTVDSYSYHCAMAPMLFATMDIRRDDYDYALAVRLIDLWRKAAGLLLRGDYYPLTPSHRSAEKWVARQFDCPETGRGLIQGIRLPASPDETLTIHPKGLNPGATYSFENPETGEAKSIAGAVLLREGFTLALPKRSGAIWLYRETEQDCAGSQD
jgi:alpha-galactosidase